LTLSDSAITGCLLAESGKNIEDNRSLTRIFYTANALRKKLGITGLLIITPLFIYIFRKNNYKYLDIFLITIPALSIIYFQLSISINIIFLRVKTEIKTIKRIELQTVIIRLVLISIIFLLPLNAAGILLLVTISFFIQDRSVNKKVSSYLVLEEKKYDKSFEKIVIFNLKQTLPNTLFFCFQGQIIYFLLSILGDTANIANVSAIGRISVIFSIFSTVTLNIILPLFAKTKKIKRLLLIYCSTLCFMLFIITILCFIAYFYPNVVLYILGERYQNLSSLLFILFINMGLNALAGLMWSFNGSKLWIKYAWTNIPCTLLLQAVLIFAYLDLKSVNDIIIFNILSITPFIIINLILTWQGIKKS
jgi:hypothetical protein